jgi:hypothetical protein
MKVFCWILATGGKGRDKICQAAKHMRSGNEQLCDYQIQKDAEKKSIDISSHISRTLTDATYRRRSGSFVSLNAAKQKRMILEGVWGVGVMIRIYHILGAYRAVEKKKR